jgi:zinc protease
MSEMVAEVIRSGGSSAWPGDRLDEELGALGADISISANPDSTTASFQCLASDFDHVLSIFQTLVQSPSFPDEKVEMVRGQMLTAIAARNDSAGQAASRESKRAYYGADDPRMRRQEEHTIRSIGVEDLKDFHASQYGSRRALLSLYGDFERESAVSTIETIFGDWPGQTAQAIQMPIAAPLAESPQVFLAHKEGGNQSEIRLLHHGVRRGHPDYPALRLGSWILGLGGFGNRMMTRIRRELGLAYGAGAAWAGRFEQQGLFQSWCATKNETTALAIREMIQVMQKYLDEGVSAGEFEEARSRLLNAGVFDVDTPSEVLERTANLEFYGYAWNFYEQVDSAIRALTPEETVAACRRHLSPDKLTVFVLGDSSAFDSELSEFGPVTQWNLEDPAHEAEAQSSDSENIQGEQLAKHLLSSHGGLVAWGETDSVWARVQAPAFGSLEFWLQYPDRSRLVVGSSDSQTSEVTTKNSGWTVHADGAVETWNAQKLKEYHTNLSGKLPYVLMALSRGEYNLRAPRENMLILEKDGRELSVLIGGDGLCEKLHLSNGFYRFEDYVLSGSLMLPTSVVWTEKGQPDFEATFEWKTHPEIQDNWFVVPK